LKSNQKATPSQSNTTRRNQTKKEPHWESPNSVTSDGFVKKSFNLATKLLLPRKRLLFVIKNTCTLSKS
jgi:hypothetical protein